VPPSDLSGQYPFIDSVSGGTDQDNQSFANIDTGTDQFCLAGFVQRIDSDPLPNQQVSFEYRSIGSIKKATEKNVTADFVSVELNLTITQLATPPTTVYDETITTGCTLKGRLRKAGERDRVRLKCDAGENFSAFPNMTNDLLDIIDDAYPKQKHIRIHTEKGRIRFIHNGEPAPEGLVSLTCGPILNGSVALE